MPDFKVYYDNEYYCGVSKVYAIDTVRDRFLVTTTSGKFMWVNISDCLIEKDDHDLECWSGEISFEGFQKGEQK